MNIYIVGGAVRDTLLGLPLTDKDWLIVGATPPELLVQGYTQVGKDFPVFLHPETKEEYALARTERKTGAGHTGFSFDVSEHVSLEDDLSRRDLTINAIAQDDDGTLHDPFNGQTDLSNGILRHVSPAFVEDPLRVFRVARFAARFCTPLIDKDFTVAPETLALMQTTVTSGELDHLSAERIWNELHKALTYSGSVRFFEVLKDCNAHGYVFNGDDACFSLALERLQQATEMGWEADLRYASYISALACETRIKKLNQFLKVPNAFADLSIIGTLLIHNLNHTTNSSDLLNAMTQAGAFNNTHHIHKALVLAELFCTQKQTVECLKNCLKACQSVSAKPFIQRGFKGKEIGEQLYRTREKIIQRAIEKQIQNI